MLLIQTLRGSRQDLYPSLELIRVNQRHGISPNCAYRRCKEQREKVQYRALKFVFNDFKSPYSILREQSGLPLLYIQRIRALLIEIYKMYNLLGPMSLHDILCKHANRMSTRNNLRLLQPKCHTATYGLSSVRYYGAKLWNELDKPLKESCIMSVNSVGH